MPTEIAVIPTNETELAQAIESELTRARAFTVQSDEDAIEADKRRQAVAKMDKFISDLLDDEREKAHANWKRLVAKIDGYKKPVEEIRKLYKGAVLPWLEKKEQERQAEQRRLEAEAKKKADDEALKKAAQEAEFGDQAVAAKIVEEAVATPAPVVKVESTAPKLNGTIFTTRWSATITNPTFVRDAIQRAGLALSKIQTKEAQEAAELLRQAFSDATYQTYDQVSLNRLAVATKGALKLGGVTFSSRKV